MKTFVITAARTSDGIPVYLTADGSWSLELDKAQPFSGPDDAAHALQNAKAQESVVCDPALFKVKQLDGHFVPMNTKARLRFEGADVLLARLGYFDIPEFAQRPGRVGT